MLRIFAAVAEHNSFSRAEQSPYISQPAVSRGVLELEEQVGPRPVDCSRQTLTLTEAGTLLYQYAQRLFAVEQAAEPALDQLQVLECAPPVLTASHTREIVEAVFTRNGLTLNVAIELGSDQAIKQALSAGLGISIVSSATIALEISAKVLAVPDRKRRINIDEYRPDVIRIMGKIVVLRSD